MNLVTGATGHIGNVLVRELRTLGQPVRALLLPGEDPTPLEDPAVERVQGDILDPASLLAAMHGVHTVFHLAGLVSILPGMWESLYRVNVLGTRNVLEACRRSGIKRLVYTSSIHAIAPPAEGAVIDERLPFDPDRAWGEYDRSKALATQAVLEAAAQGLDAVVVCPTGVIGPYDFRRSEMGSFLLDCAEPGPKVFVDGAYDFVDVRDVASGHVLARDRGRAGQTYILAGARLGVRQLIGLVEEITGVVGPHLRIPFWLAWLAAHFTPMYYRLTRSKPRFTPYSLHTLASPSRISPAKARRELGYRTRSPRETIADALRWFAEWGARTPALARTIR